MKKVIYLLFTVCLLAGCGSSDSDTDVPDVPNKPDTPSGEYVNETFSTSFGSFSVANVSGTPWVIDYSSAKATGYDNASKETTPSESYLVSSPIDLSKSTGAKITFQYILRYYTNYGTPYGGVADQVLITDYYTGNPKTTKWTDISGTLSEGTTWDKWYDYSMNIPSEFIGKKGIVIALRYACGEKSATWEVKNLKVTEGNYGTEVPDGFFTSSSGVNENMNDATSQQEVSRLEFPHLKDGNSIVLVHSTSDSYGVNYSVEWDCDKKSQRWSCYQLYNGFGGNVGRYSGSPQYPFDPLLDDDKYLSRDYFKGSGYDHGHICPSADRQYSAEANKQTFYLTNMQPQKNSFNAGVWGSMEEKVRRWIALSPITDTLFVCKGGTIDNEDDIIERISNKLIVPRYFYMAVVYKSPKGYKAIAFFADQTSNSSKNDDLRKYVISIDELEQRTGIDFFCNLPDDVENKVEATAIPDYWTW